MEREEKMIRGSAARSAARRRISYRRRKKYENYITGARQDDGVPLR